MVNPLLGPGLTAAVNALDRQDDRDAPVAPRNAGGFGPRRLTPSLANLPGRPGGLTFLDGIPRLPPVIRAAWNETVPANLKDIARSPEGYSRVLEFARTHKDPKTSQMLAQMAIDTIEELNDRTRPSSDEKESYRLGAGNLAMGAVEAADGYNKPDAMLGVLGGLGAAGPGHFAEALSWAARYPSDPTPTTFGLLKALDRPKTAREFGEFASYAYRTAGFPKPDGQPDLVDHVETMARGLAVSRYPDHPAEWRREANEIIERFMSSSDDQFVPSPNGTGLVFREPLLSPALYYEARSPGGYKRVLEFAETHKDPKTSQMFAQMAADTIEALNDSMRPSPGEEDSLRKAAATLAKATLVAAGGDSDPAMLRKIVYDYLGPSRAGAFAEALSWDPDSQLTVYRFLKALEGPVATLEWGNFAHYASAAGFPKHPDKPGMPRREEYIATLELGRSARKILLEASKD
jgi:hypothetical protein